MGIAIGFLPEYKSFRGTAGSFYDEHKAPGKGFNERAFEEFRPIWEKLIADADKFAGSRLNLKRRILDREYSEYPIVFIWSKRWPEMNGDGKPHGYTEFFVVDTQNQNIKNIKTFEHRYIDREVGVIICEKTELYDGAVEPNYRHWFYEKDNRQRISTEILKGYNEEKDGIYFTIEKLKELPKEYPGWETKSPVNMEDYENNYVKRHGYLKVNDELEQLIKNSLCSERLCISARLIEWDDSWSFVLKDYYGQKLFRVETRDALQFIESIGGIGQAVK